MFALNWTCRLQEELSIEVVELSQELEVLQEKLDRRRADEHQAALDDLLRRFNEQGGEADPEELLLQVRKLQHFLLFRLGKFWGQNQRRSHSCPTGTDQHADRAVGHCRASKWTDGAPTNPASVIAITSCRRAYLCSLVPLSTTDLLANNLLLSDLSVQREHDADMSARAEKIAELETLLTMSTDEIARVTRARSTHRRSTHRRSRSRPKPRHSSHPVPCHSTRNRVESCDGKGGLNRPRSNLPVASRRPRTGRGSRIG